MHIFKNVSFLFYIAIVISICFSCSSNEPKETTLKTEDSLTLKNVSELKPIESMDSSMIFTNIEQIEYCLPLPLNDYAEVTDKDEVRAKHVFSHKAKKDNEMEVQGLFRDDPSVTIEESFKNRYISAEEDGKIIMQKEIVKNNNCFYAKGSWSNLIYKLRFIEIVWFPKDEVVKFYSSFDVKDTSIWDQRLQTLISSTSNCN